MSRLIRGKAVTVRVGAVEGSGVSNSKGWRIELAVSVEAIIEAVRDLLD